MISSLHVQPKDLDDSLSAAVFDRFIDYLDPLSLYFIKPDIEKLGQSRRELDDMVRSGNCSFFREVIFLYRERLVLADTIVGTLISRPLDFTKKEELSFSRKRTHTYAANETELRQRWNKWMRYQVLTKLFTAQEEGEDPYQLDTKTLLTREKKARTDVGTAEKRSIAAILESPMGFDRYVHYLFYNAFAGSFDPHTVYFSYDDKEDFEEAISTENLSFGIEIKNNHLNEVEISDLAPGGAAWKSNELNKGDVIIAAEWKGRTTDLTSATANDVYDLLSQGEVKEIRLTVRKTNGAIRTVKLVKEMVRSDENVIRGFVLSGEKKIGYISLPAFYRDASGMKGCADDVAKELILLKKENIEGLILDLRNNGGGSVMEALDLAGIFIDVGPVTVARGQDNTPVVLKDANRGVVYDGPLIIMVNGASASASEIFAAAMQDHHRALIVGSQTYGKSTGQQIFPLDPTAKGDNAYVKVTTARYNRITGKTHQLGGVMPDIVLPDMFAYLDYREKDEKFALAPDSITKKIYYTPLAPPPAEELSLLSVKRVNASKAFNSIINIGNILRDMEENVRSVPLQIDDYKAAKDDMLYNWELWEEMADHETDAYTVASHAFAGQINLMDEYSREISEALIKNIREDVYIEESYRVMCDYINFIK